MLVTSIFSISQNVFYAIKEKIATIEPHYNCRQLLSWTRLKFCLEKIKVLKLHQTKLLQCNPTEMQNQMTRYIYDSQFGFCVRKSRKHCGKKEKNVGY